MISNESEFIAQIESIIDEADLVPLIVAEVRRTKDKLRNQLYFSLFEAGLKYGVNLILNHNDVIERDYPVEVAAEADFDYYSIGSRCVEEKLSRIVSSLPDAEGIDFILTTHDGVYYRDLRKRTDFEGSIDIE